MQDCQSEKGMSTCIQSRTEKRPKPRRINGKRDRRMLFIVFRCGLSFSFHTAERVRTPATLVDIRVLLLGYIFLVSNFKINIVLAFFDRNPLLS